MNLEESSSSVCFAGLKFPEGGLKIFTDRILSIEAQSGTAFHLVNAYTVAEADRSLALRYILKKDFLICDGKPLSMYLKKSLSSIEHVRGADLMRNVVANSNHSHQHFFIGGNPTLLSNLIEQLRNTSAEFNVAGRISPPYQDSHEEFLEDWANSIRGSGANIVWIGLGTPKQDFIAHKLARSTKANIIAVGAAFDFISGNKREAPLVFSRFSLEWLFRLFQEPRRLGYRYLVCNMRFLKIISKEFFS